jgi:hypothetical protein
MPSIEGLPTSAQETACDYSCPYRSEFEMHGSEIGLMIVDLPSGLFNCFECGGGGDQKRSTGAVKDRQGDD